MATYITLVNWTDQGVSRLKEAPARIESFKELCTKEGVELRGLYATMGDFDFVGILDAPSADVVARLVLTLGSFGNVRTKTMPAFDTPHFADIVASLE